MSALLQSFSLHQLNFQTLDLHLEDPQRHSHHLYWEMYKKGSAKLHLRPMILRTQV